MPPSLPPLARYSSTILVLKSPLDEGRRLVAVELAELAELAGEPADVLVIELSLSVTRLSVGSHS